MQVRLLGPVDVLAAMANLGRSAACAGRPCWRRWPCTPARSSASASWSISSGRTPRRRRRSRPCKVTCRTCGRIWGTAAAIGTRPSGYVLDLGGDGTDVQRRSGCCGRRGRRPTRAAGSRILRSALGLWRGPALADLAELPWLAEQATRLDLLQARIKRAWVEARLAAGEDATLVPDLEQLVAEQPLDEQLHGQLMLALYRSGRAGGRAGRLPSAAACARRGAGHLPRPGAARPGDGHPPAGPGPATLPAPAGTGVRGPRRAARCRPSCRPAVPAFTGRERRTGQPGRAAAGAGRYRRGRLAVLIAAISGTAGVGKTTLAVHWAHRVAARFPDGQLYVNLRGFDPGGAALEPGEAIRGFLEALGVPAARIPADLRRPGRRSTAACWRAGGCWWCWTTRATPSRSGRCCPARRAAWSIVTSRNQLTGLVAAEGAHPLTAGPAHRRRRPRTAGPPPGTGPGGRASPDAVDEIIAALRPAAAGAGHRRRPRGHPPRLPAGRRRRRAARGDAAPWTPSTAATWPPTSGRCSPGPTAR